MSARLNGCHNREPFKADVRVQDGWTPETRPYRGAPDTHEIITSGRRMVSIPFRMNPECQYTHTVLGQADAACAGCKHRAEAAS